MTPSRWGEIDLHLFHGSFFRFLIMSKSFSQMMISDKTKAIFSDELLSDCKFKVHQ